MYKQDTFIQSLLAAKAFISCPYELRTSKSYLRAIPTTILFYLTQSIHAETSFVRAVNARRFNSGYTCSNLLITLLAEPLIGLSTSGSLEVIQDLPMITDQEYSGHCRRKIKALYAKVHLNFSRKVQPLFYFVKTGFGYKLVTDRTTIYFYSWNQHHRANFITYSFFIRSDSTQILLHRLLSD